jgi:chromosome segregation ATPase
MITRTAVFAAAALMLAPLAAHAQPKEQYTYRCTGKDGRKHYGQTLPQACLGRPLELINKQGLVVKRIDPEAEEKARIAKEADAEKKREMDAAQKDAMRRNQALLATYTSEKDIEESRARALREHKYQLEEVENRIDEIKKRQARFEKDLAVYKEAGKGEPPSRLREEITNAQIDLKAQQGLLDAKKKEAAGINARYDEDRRRYREAIGAAPRASTK